MFGYPVKRRPFGILLAFVLCVVASCVDAEPTGPQPSVQVLFRDAHTTITRDKGYLVRTVDGVERRRYLEGDSRSAWSRLSSDTKFISQFEVGVPSSSISTELRIYADGRQQRVSQTALGLIVEELNPDGRLHARTFVSQSDIKRAAAERERLKPEVSASEIPCVEGEGGGCDVPSSCHGDEECESAGPLCVMPYLAWKALQVSEAAALAARVAAQAAEASAWYTYLATQTEAAYQLWNLASIALELKETAWAAAVAATAAARAVYELCINPV